MGGFGKKPGGREVSWSMIWTEMGFRVRHFGALLWLAAVPALAAADGERDFWDWSQKGKIVHRLVAEGAPVVLCMQGQRVVMEAHVDQAKGLEYKARFFGLQDPLQKTKLMFQGGAGSLPAVICDGQAYAWGELLAVEFDGKLTLRYALHQGIEAIRTVYPSPDKAVVVETWTLVNRSNREVSIEVLAGQKRSEPLGQWVTAWDCPAPGLRRIAQGGELRFHSTAQVHALDVAALAVDADAEGKVRGALADAAWNGPGRLEVPDPMLTAAYALQKLHVLETPIQTHKGLITHNGSLTYTPGIWANDPVEYSSPLFPFFGDKVLNDASMNMYRIWLDYCREHGIDPFPGSFEHEALRLTQRDRGDDAMVLYGLSKFLLFQGDRKAAEEMWPLIEYSVASIEKHLNADSVVASKTDEMEDRYPTGNANLSTSALAYGGYVHAARLARSLGKEEVAQSYETKAGRLALAIESFFGAEVEGFKTYRYYKENNVLRGWILLPPAMGITQRQDATLDAMVSDKLWPNRMQGGDILAASDRRETEWGRETYYALRVLFKAGRTEQALDLTRRVVKAQIFGPRGPYPDEDAIDMLCPGSLYPRVFTEGLFGISPLGFDRFECVPHLPAAWPKMALRDMRAFGSSWDLVVERDGAGQKVTVLREGKPVFSGRGPAGTVHVVDFNP